MSADNAIYIQQIDGLWWVWMGLGDEPGKPSEGDKSFSTKEQAVEHALWMLCDEPVVEYGIIMLPACASKDGVYHYIVSNPGTDVIDIAERFGVSYSEAHRIVDDLIGRNRITKAHGVLYLNTPLRRSEDRQ